MKKVIYFSFLLVLSFKVEAQHALNYTPIQNQGSISKDFLTDPLLATKKNVESNRILSTNQADLFYSQMNFLKNQLFESGLLYLQNNITQYIDSVKNRLLASEPKLNAEIKIYLTRYTRANAFCFPDGSIFINIGLFAVLKSEPEFAFILAHEIAHYSAQHNIKDLKRLTGINNKEVNYKNENSNTYRSLKFSRESELDADAWALQMMALAGYDPKYAADALHKLKENTNPSTLDPEKIFTNEMFTVDTSWYNTSALIQAKYYFEEENERILSSWNLGDLFETHPDLDKRVDAVNLLVKNLNIKQFKATNQSYDRIGSQAEFERIENNYREQDYLNAVINSLHLLVKYPDNNYLHISVSRSLYWLSYYKEINANDLSIEGDKYQNPSDFYKLYALIDRMSLSDAKKLVYAYSRNKYDKLKASGEFLFYLAVSTENYLGKAAARNYYFDYRSRFPNGTFSEFTKNRLQ